MIKYFYTVVFIFFISAWPPVVNGQVAPEEVDEQLLKESVEAVLGNGQQIDWIKKPITPEIKQSLKDKLKIKSTLPDTLYLGKVQTDGGARYIIPDIAPSKSEKYSYVLYLKDSKEIVDVDVLEYRENYGYEIDYSFFREQFQGKKSPQELRFKRTVQNISGATISARSLTYSVHDLLALIQKIELK
jgi:Na+-translocating ferredoxin:NAD+ oxidoreductase RnfG subunit